MPVCWKLLIRTASFLSLSSCSDLSPKAQITMEQISSGKTEVFQSLNMDDKLRVYLELMTYRNSKPYVLSVVIAKDAKNSQAVISAINSSRNDEEKYYLLQILVLMKKFGTYDVCEHKKTVHSLLPGNLDMSTPRWQLRYVYDLANLCITGDSEGTDNSGHQFRGHDTN